MRKYYRFAAVCLVILIAIGAVGCKKEEKQRTGDRSIFYVNMDQTGIVSVPYEAKKATAGQEVETILKKMKEPPDSLEYQAAIPEMIMVQGITGITNEQKILGLDFNSEYMQMDPVTEVLMREAIVRTMVQIEGIDSVVFTVDQVPLKDKYGKEIGEMRSSDFLKDTGSALHSYKVTTLNLYFGNENGDQLVEQRVRIPYNSNTSLEKVVLEQLVEGPSNSKMTGTLPKELKILSVAVRDGVCYVNLDETFLSGTYQVQPKVAIMSIVNSIIDSGSVSQVQISVNGSGDQVFQGSIPLDRPFSMDLDIVEGSK